MSGGISRLTLKKTFPLTDKLRMQEVNEAARISSRWTRCALIVQRLQEPIEKLLKNYLHLKANRAKVHMLWNH
jgi:hypothetical protein